MIISIVGNYSITSAMMGEESILWGVASTSENGRLIKNKRPAGETDVSVDVRIGRKCLRQRK